MPAMIGSVSRERYDELVNTSPAVDKPGARHRHLDPPGQARLGPSVPPVLSATGCEALDTFAGPVLIGVLPVQDVVHQPQVRITLPKKSSRAGPIGGLPELQFLHIGLAAGMNTCRPNRCDGNGHRGDRGDRASDHRHLHYWVHLRILTGTHPRERVTR
ncbi:hypothetical protein [Streptomyces sp. bgisy034]|uniref:hypothetical protein n=1 Tax=Streptomyces sp. bgisy034 TaxID=3413774 RepID=UPI003EBD4AF1